MYRNTSLYGGLCKYLRFREAVLAFSNAMPDHLRRIDNLVELFFVDVPGLERGLLQGEAVVVR